MSLDAKKLECIQHKFVVQCQNRILLKTMLLMGISLNFLKFIPCTTETFILHYFFISVNSRLKFCPYLLVITGIQVLSYNFSNSSLFTATCKNCLSASCVLATNHVCKGINIFKKPITSLKQILC